MRPLLRLLGSVLVLAMAARAAAQPATPVGRWVNVDPRDVQLLVLNVEADGTAHRLIPAPQFSASYRLDADRVIVTMGDGSGDSLTFQYGELLRSGRPAFRRLPGAATDQASVQGTWRPTAAGSMEQFWTFRSDGQLILEVGFPGSVLTGNTLTLSDGSYTVRHVGDRLEVEGGGKQRRFVQRPWGCFGTPTDAAAPECR